VPTFSRTGSGAWHVVGPDGCRYGRAFAEDPDASPDESATATDVIAYEPPADRGSESPAAADPGRSSYGPRGDQRLVLPRAVRESDADLCRSCRSVLERHQERRARVIGELKRSATLRDGDWTVTDHGEPQPCDWCGAHERTTWHSEPLRCRVCPACGRLFDGPFGDPGDGSGPFDGPGDGSGPDADRLPDTPSEPVTPVLLGTTRAGYDPTELVGSNRPVVKYRERRRYVDLVLDLGRTGHAFTGEAVAALDEVRAGYAGRVAGDDDHRVDVALSVGPASRSVTLEGILVDDSAAVIEAVWAVLRDPDNWFPIGWPEGSQVHHGAAAPSIPGDDPVAEAFPRLRTRADSAESATGTESGEPRVATQSLRAATDPGRYERGVDYHERGLVTDLVRVDDVVEASVQGSQRRPYEVHVRLDGGRYVDGRCDCPDDAVPCKHVVAAALAARDGGDVEGTSAGRSLEGVLDEASADDLRALLRDAAEDDVRLRKRIYDELDGE